MNKSKQPLPKEGDIIHTQKDTGTVLHINTTKQSIVVDLEKGGVCTVTLDQLIFEPIDN